MSTQTTEKTGFVAPPAPEPELAEVWGRALASDANRAHWLSVRRTRITGTDMGVVMRGRGQTKVQHFRKKAAGEETNIGRQKAVEWGNYREERLIEAFAGSGWHRCGLLIGAAFNDRHTSTPDIMGVNFGGEIEIREVKTSSKDLDPAGPDFKATRYFEQIIGQIYTTGAARVILTVEQHNDDWSRWADRPGPEWEFDNGTTLDDYGPEIVKVHEYVFEAIDYADEIADQRAKVDEALVALDEALVGFVADGPEVFTPEQQRVYGVEARKFADGAAAEKRGAQMKAEAKAELLALAAGWDSPDVAELDRGTEGAELSGRREFSERFDGIKVTYSPDLVGEPSEVADPDAAKLANPDAWERVKAAESALAEAVAGPRAALTAAQDQWAAVLSEHRKTEPGKLSPAKVTVTPPRKAN